MTALSDRCIEAMARAMCLDAGQDPDSFDVSMICGPNNEPMPLWRYYETPAAAALTVLLSELDAAGWQIVPKKPDEMMVIEGYSASHHIPPETEGAREVTCYKGMLSAAPQPFPEDKP